MRANKNRIEKSEVDQYSTTYISQLNERAYRLLSFEENLKPKRI